MEDILAVAPVVPVVKVHTPDAGVRVAQALVRGGVPVIELTLRTSAALETIRAIAEEVPEILLGAGTVTTPEQVALVVEAGARFIVTPGAPHALQQAVLDAGVPALLGASTLTEMMQLASQGWRTLKFFPAEAAGGTKFLASVRGPLPELRFCPTGGINIGNAPEYLELPNIAAVGGSWLTPDVAVESGDWELIEKLAREAAALQS